MHALNVWRMRNSHQSFILPSDHLFVGRAVQLSFFSFSTGIGTAQETGQADTLHLESTQQPVGREYLMPDGLIFTLGTCSTVGNPRRERNKDHGWS